LGDLVSLSGEDRVDHGPDHTPVCDLAQVLGCDDRAGVGASFYHLSEHEAMQPEIVPSVIRSIRRPSASAVTGDCSMSTPSLLNALNKSPG
jgi:hypothetical protein